MQAREVSEPKSFGLVGDIGGTNARFAAVDIDSREPAILSVRTLSTPDHPDIVAAARAYLHGVGLRARPGALVFAVAGPVENNEIHLTNAGWRISGKELQAGLGARFALVVNDFEAIAQAVPNLQHADLCAIGSSPPFDLGGEGTIAILGPGTGLGVGGLIRKDGARVALVTEGGHGGFSPTDEMEMRILAILQRKFGRVSAERILSGPGLLNLHGALAEIEGRARGESTPENITQIARDDPQSFEARVFAHFCEILGSVAGDVALVMGARQGVLIAGGILPDMATLFARSGFRRRFEDKARFAGYMRAIPTSLILDPHAGLIGAASILQSVVCKDV